MIRSHREGPTYTFIRAISGIPARSATRALQWAVETRVLVNRGGTYVPGAPWVAREDRAVAQRLGERLLDARLCLAYQLIWRPGATQLARHGKRSDNSAPAPGM